jgi:hypothetical protein
MTERDIICTVCTIQLEISDNFPAGEENDGVHPEDGHDGE